MKNKGYDIFNFDGTGMLEVEKLDSSNRFENDAEAVAQAVKDGIKIIPIEELPYNMDEDLKYFGWVDTAENREAIKKYCKRKVNNINVTGALNFLKKYDHIYYITIINNLEAYTDNQIIKYAKTLREEYERGYGNAF